MYLLLSGEGPGDIGICYPANDSCDRAGLREGPMATIVDPLIEVFQQYEMSHLECDLVSYVSESYLSDNKRPTRKKSMSLKGKKKPAETRYYFENARVLASVAKVKSAEVGDQVIAILYGIPDTLLGYLIGEFRIGNEVVATSSGVSMSSELLSEMGYWSPVLGTENHPK